MFRRLLAVALLLPLLPTPISAQCADCDSYTAALQSCQTTKSNVTAVGTAMDSTTLNCMCMSKSGVIDMNACQACDESNPSSSLDIILLSAWTTTCRAESKFGEQQAATCWESQPSNFMPCVAKTGTDGSGSGSGSGSGGGSGSVGGGTTSGGDVAGTTSATSG